MASKKYTAPLGASLVVMSSIFYASYGIWTKLMGDFFQGYTASALRSVLVLLILLPIAIFYRHLEPIHLKQNWRYLTGMVLASLFTWGPLYYAILHAGVGISLAVAKLIDAGAAGILGLLEIVFGVLFGIIFFHERPAAMALLGMVVIIAAAAIPYFRDYNAKRGT
jgi:drug/metabolite transporter (DMT)-like permease